MKQEIILDAAQGRVTLALIEDGTVREVMLCRAHDEVSQPGAIYWGRVQRVMPGIQAAFVDIGLEKNAFLPLGEAHRVHPPVRQGEGYLVQVRRQPKGDKGLCVAREITMPGRLAVLLPIGGEGGVSAKITAEGERARLKALAQVLCAPGEAVIWRTAAQGASERALADELAEQRALWQRLAAQGAHRREPGLLWAAQHPVERFVRDALGESLARVVVGDDVWHERLARVLPAWGADPARLLTRYAGTLPMQDAYGVRRAITNGLHRRVWLDCGGFLIFDTCEAMTVVDVNTGKYAGSATLEETAFTVDCEAARAVAEQLRLRDVGGIVVIDFIDLRDETHREALMNALRAALTADRGKPVLVGGMSELGLVQLTRKRLYGGLAEAARAPCPTCGTMARVPHSEQESEESP